MSQFFTVHHRSKKSKARLGTIKTSHGEVQTPSFVPVATKATLKSLTAPMVKDIGAQIQFVNTYHLVVHPGADILEKAGGAHTFSRLPTPLMSDSGGFQVFSLANNKRQAAVHGEETPLVLKIWEDGVIFRSTHDGTTVEFTPEKSMFYQQQIGADLLMAFDECTSSTAEYKYFERAMDRTHEWLQRCITFLKENPSIHGYPQYLYGIIQGGQHKDLRIKSAEFVCNQPTPGIAVGGIAVGETKKEMREQVEWVSPYLPADRPVHMLGIGGFDDMYDLIKLGGDTFDCVEPTRAARMGMLYQWGVVAMQQKLPPEIVQKVSTVPFSATQETKYELDITKTIYRDNLTAVDTNCDCYVCLNYTKAYLHHLFKQKELVGYTLASYHNLWVMEKFMKVMREMIAQDLL